MRIHHQPLTTRHLVAVAASIALVGAACGSATSSPNAGAPATVDGDQAAANDQATATPDDTQTSDLPDLGPAPEFVGLDGWLQNPDGIDQVTDLEGKVSVVQIWTFSCSNCKNTLPNLKSLRDMHDDDDDFQIVGIHSPEFDFEEDPDAIAAAAEELDVTWPIALDTEGDSFWEWQEGNRAYWPRTFVVDQQGTIRFDRIGEGAYDELNATVAALLAEPAA